MANRASVSRKAPVVAAKYGGAWSNDASPPTSNATRHLATHGPKYHFPADPLYYIGRIPLDIMKQSVACMQVTLGPDAQPSSPLQHGDAEGGRELAEPLGVQQAGDAGPHDAHPHPLV